MGKLKRRRRWLFRIAAATALSIALGATFEEIGARRDARRFPATGERVDIGGRRLYLDCRGQGSPTVLLEAGHDSWSPAWTSVEPEIAKRTRVCSYDRAGLGNSEPGPSPRTAESVTKDLEALLAHAGIAPPYVLVGHSAGGMYQRLFYAAHPDAVAGMVLVDTDEPTTDTDRKEVAAAPDDKRAQLLLTLAVYTGLVRLFEPGKEESARYPEEARVRFRASLAPLARHLNDEWMLYQDAYAKVTDLSLGDRPLVILGALGYLHDHEDREDRRARQQRLAKLSTHSQLIVLDDELHFLPLLRPDVVTKAVIDVLTALRPTR